MKWEVDEDNFGGEMEAASTLLDKIKGIVDFVTSLMPLDFVACDAKFGAKVSRPAASPRHWQL